jgi:dTDP-glucose 4,6-dehydratase
MSSTPKHYGRVVITGAAGFIGSHFLRSLVENQLCISSSEITVVDLLTYASNYEDISDLIEGRKVDFKRGDISSHELMSEILKKADLVVNFAAESHVDKSIEDSSAFIKTNVLGVDVILNILKENKKCRFVQISTDEVYGSVELGEWDEKCSLSPNSPYSASKASADLLTLAYARTHGVDAVITRCSNNYGPNQNLEKFIPTCINQILKNKKIPIYGNGMQKREWIHVSDHCKGIATAITHGKSGEIYNIGSGIELTNISLASQILKVLKKDESLIEYVEDRKGHDYRYAVDYKKIRDLGFVNEIDFKQGLEQTINWYKEKDLIDAER